MEAETNHPQPGPFVFHPNVGQPLPAREALHRTAAYRRDEESHGHKRGEYTESEFFGIDMIQDLIRRHPGAVGIRCYYGINAHDPDGSNTRRLTLVAVDAKGHDLFTGGSLRGIKDPGDGETLGDGYTCPKHCPT